MRILREKECKEMTGLSRVTRWRKERKGEFPKRVNLGDNSIGWLESEVAAWLRDLERGAKKKGLRGGGTGSP